MIRSLRTTLSAAALSAVLALGAIGAGTAPAQADSRDAAAVLGGIIALYALGRALDNGGPRQVPSQNFHNPGHPAPPAHVPHHPRQRVAPAHCYREFQTNDGYFRGYSGRCLQRSVQVGLPDACAREYHTTRGPRLFFGGRCMAQNGWVHEGGGRFY